MLFNDESIVDCNSIQIWLNLFYLALGHIFLYKVFELHSKDTFPIEGRIKVKKIYHLFIII